MCGLLQGAKFRAVCQMLIEMDTDGMRKAACAFGAK